MWGLGLGLGSAADEPYSDLGLSASDPRLRVKA